MPSMHRAPSAVAPSLSGSSSTQPDCDVALVGGGVIGLAAALALSRCGYQVQVLERGEVQLRVIEARIKEVQVEGANFFDKENI